MSGAFIFVISSLKIPSVTGSCSHMTGTGLGVILLAAALGDLFTYCVTSVQLALAYPSASGAGTSVVKFLGVFAPTQLPLCLLEGIITVLIMIGLEKYASMELKKIGFIGAGR